MSTATDSTRTVLVVDDFDDTRLLLRTWLERRGFRVIEAENGLQAIDQAETQSPDLIIMDRELPDGDGFSFAYRIKSDRATCRIPIIGFTATPLNEAMRAAHSSGLDGFCAKPCPSEKLVSLALMLLGQAARASAS